MQNQSTEIGLRVGSFLTMLLLAAVLMAASPAVGQHSRAGLSGIEEGPLPRSLAAPKPLAIRVPIPVSDYKLAATAQGHEIALKDFGNLLVPGKPVLPSKIFAIAIPPGAEVVDVLADLGAGITLPGTYSIAPAPLPRVIGLEDPAVYKRQLDSYQANFDSVYGRDDPYPASVVEFVRSAGYRRYNLVDVRVTPFTYRPVSGKLTYYPEVAVRVVYQFPGKLRAGIVDSLARTEQVAKDIIVNYNQVKNWYPQKAFANRGLHDFVIVTLDTLTSSVVPLVDWEIHKGRTVEVATTSWIDANYTGDDLAEKIRNFLRDKYPSGEWGIEDVLLVGHYDDVPMRRTAQDLGYGRPETDLYYAELSLPDDQSWDADDDHQYGEDSDPIDFYSEVNVGRIPWSDPSTVLHICQKSAAYEQNSDPTFKKNILLLGAYFWEDTDNAKLMEAKAAQPWMADWTMTRMYEKNADYSSSYPCDYPLLRSNVVSVWGFGRFSFVNWAGHGSYRSSHIYGIGAPAFIDSSDCPSLSDAYPSIIFADACSNSETDYDSIGRAMLKRGGVAFVGATKVALGAPAWDDPYDGSGQSLDYFFTSYVTSGDFTTGQAHQKALRDMYTYGLWYAPRYEMFEWGALLGNPHLGIGPPPVLSILLPDGPPRYADPDAPTTFSVQIVGGIEDYVPGSGLLHYRLDYGIFETFLLTHDTGNLYEATLPPGGVYEAIEFYVSAEGDGGTTVSSPSNAPSSVYAAMVGTFVKVVDENLDADPGWTTQGQWAFGQPTGGGGEYGGPDPTGGYTGDNVYGYNLDGDYPNNLPERHLTSTSIDCSDVGGVTLKFWRWIGVEHSMYDHAYLRISNNGSDWTTIWENGKEITDSTWGLHEYDISAVADGQPSVYLRWTMGPTDGGWRYCGWNVDDVEVWGFVTCFDGILNQGEERIDCGGLCAPCDCTSDGACIDGLFCNGDETCDSSGHCQPGAGCPPDLCDEDNDICAPCQNDGQCDDELYCDGVETCDAFGICQPGASVDCDDGVDCTINSCSNTLGSCENIPYDDLCYDGNVCTVNWCVPDSGCLSDGTGVTVPCDDGNACTLDDICQGDAQGTCKGTTMTAAPEAGEGNVVKNRYLSVASGNPGRSTAIRVRFVDLPDPFEAHEGRTMWVGMPREFCENSGQDTPPQGGCGAAPGLESPVSVGATLQCDPYYANWSTYGTIHVRHGGIVPSGRYDLQEIDLVCDAADEGSYSAPLELTTSIWGDVVGDCSTTPCSPPDGVVGVPTDVTAVLDKFRNLEGAPIKARCDIEPSEPDRLINISDVTCTLDAFRGFDYPFEPGPDPCSP